jgi:hypothetical protein
MRGSLAAMLLAVAGLAANPAGAEIIRKEDTLRGITTTREQCAAKPQTMWLNAYGQDFCVRYYLSTAGGQGTRPVVILNGDHNGRLDPVRWAWEDPSAAQDLDTNNLVGMADHFSKMTRTTAIYLGRIGVEGTSGSHLSRKTQLELNLIDVALEALRLRYQFEGFHLFGESGGGRLVFGLGEMRRDVGCLISGSGQIVTNRTIAMRPNDPTRTYFDISKGPTGTARKAQGVITSGVRAILVDWGDRTPAYPIRSGAQHAYARPGRYVLRLLVTDRAGNRTTVRQLLKIAKPPKTSRKGRARRRRSPPAPVLVLRSAPPRPAPVLARR